MNNFVFRSLLGQPRGQRGISLIEALVALVVVALGMLSLAQVQSQLRFNADLSRQRAEAVRFAQEDMENWRGFSQLGTGVGKVAYDDIVSQAATAVAGQTNTNTTFYLTRTVTTSTDPNYKTLQVEVKWAGRNGEDQSVSINSLISRTDPSLATELSIPPSGSPVRNPLNRNIRIPTSAVQLGNNKSGFTPPGGSGYFVFNNINADIIERCTGTLSQLSYEAIKNGTDLTNICNPRPGYLISGFINFDLRNNISAISPGSTVCDFYQDLGTLIAAATPTLNVASVIVDPVSVAVAPATDKVYYVNVVTLANSTPVDGQANVSLSGNLVVALTSETKNANTAAFTFSASPTPAITLRVKGGAVVETFTPTANNGSDVKRSGDSGTRTALSGLTLTLGPTANLSTNTVYELVIPSGLIKAYDSKKSTTFDTNGPITVTFSTGTGPTLVASSPIDNGTMGAVSDNITMTFDRNVVGGVGIVTLLKAQGNSFTPVESFNAATGTSGSGGTITFSGSTVTINPGADLQAGTNYAIQVQYRAIKDSNGINYAGIFDNTTFNFATAAAVVGSCPTSETIKPYLGMQLNLSDTGTGVPYVDLPYECFTDAATAATSATTATIGYFCAVYAHDHDNDTATPIQWSGVLNVLGPTGWLTGNDSNYKVCRYHDPDGNGTDDTYFEHPASYGGVHETITDQNFLVIHKNRSCPNDTLNVGSQTGAVVYFSTAQLQP